MSTAIENNPAFEVVDRRSDRITVNMGPQHPATHGVLRLEIVTDGEVVEKITPHIGYLHRDFEKHCEQVQWDGVVPFTDRMDYVAAMNNNLAYCLSVEKLMGVEIPPRGQHLRVLAAELNRIASHLLAFGTYAIDLGAFTPFLYGFRERERILNIFERMCGARLTYAYPRVGGVSRDIDDKTISMCRDLVAVMRQALPKYNTLLTDNKIFRERTVGIGVLPADAAIAWGVTGPILRGSGVKWDLRKEDPNQPLYKELEFDIPVGGDGMGVLGDCMCRYWVRIREIEESVNLVEQVLDRMPKGPHRADIKAVRVPKGEAYTRTETPRGELGFYIISDGKKGPYRCKARSPCFCNLSVISELGKGNLIADLVAILGSIDIVLGEVDR